MGYGPVEASGQALHRAGMSIGDVGLVEINESFAAQVIPPYRDVGIDLDRLNVNGGAVAVGHPFGMTGARITSRLINSLEPHDNQFGVETMSRGGGTRGDGARAPELSPCTKPRHVFAHAAAAGSASETAPWPLMPIFYSSSTARSLLRDPRPVRSRSCSEWLEALRCQRDRMPGCLLSSARAIGSVATPRC